ncbi:MAG TPA: hypothetical protein DCW71_00990 [Alistipes sp.]|nr:hypothetical protein [Alistipes sp.]
MRSEDLPNAPEDAENPATRGRFRKDCGTLQKEAKAAPPADRDHPLRRSGRKSREAFSGRERPVRRRSAAFAENRNDRPRKPLRRKTETTRSENRSRRIPRSK